MYACPIDEFAPHFSVVSKEDFDIVFKYLLRIIFQIEWINGYHEQCRLVVGKLLEETGKDAALKWLLRETQPIG